MKKVIKISVIIIGIILIPVIGVISYFYVAFNNFSLEDEYQVNENNLAYFNESYNEARYDFKLKSNEYS